MPNWESHLISDEGKLLALQNFLPGRKLHRCYLFNPSNLQWNTNTVTSKNMYNAAWKNNKGKWSDGLSGCTRWFWCGIGPFQLLQPQAEDREAVMKCWDLQWNTKRCKKVSKYPAVHGYHIVRWHTMEHQCKSRGNERMWCSSDTKSCTAASVPGLIIPN